MHSRHRLMGLPVSSEDINAQAPRKLAERRGRQTDLVEAYSVDDL